MRVFSFLRIDEALAYAMKGGQAVHLHNIVIYSDAPKCFRDAVNRKECIAHLFDQDKDRLIQTVKGLGVKVVYIDGGEGTPNQHIDLCGGPLRGLLLRFIHRMLNKRRIEQADSLVGHLLKEYPGTKKWGLLR